MHNPEGHNFIATEPKRYGCRDIEDDDEGDDDNGDGDGGDDGENDNDNDDDGDGDDDRDDNNGDQHRANTPACKTSGSKGTHMQSLRKKLSSV